MADDDATTTSAFDEHDATTTFAFSGVTSVIASFTFVGVSAKTPTDPTQASESALVPGVSMRSIKFLIAIHSGADKDFRSFPDRWNLFKYKVSSASPMAPSRFNTRNVANTCWT
jgi:hypothetical protein